MRARGEGERRRQADLELRFAAPLLDNSSPPASRPFRGAAPASLLGRPHLPWSRSSISAAAGIGSCPFISCLHLRWPSAVILVCPCLLSVPLCSAWYAPASSLFPPPGMTLPGAWYPVSALSIVVFNASCSAFAHAACALLVLCFYITEPSFFSVTHIY